MKREIRAALFAFSFLLLLILPAPAEEPTPDALRSLLEKHRTPLVTIEAKIERSVSGALSRTSESTSEFHGVLIDASGVILTTSAPFRSTSRTFQGREIEINKKPKKIQVEIEGHASKQAAYLGTTVSSLGLAFLKLKKPDDTSFKSLDLEVDQTPSIGEHVVWISRKTEPFDYAPYFSVTRINGMVSKPRKLWTLMHGLPAGLPMFAPDGTLLGVSVKVSPDDGAQSGGLFGGLLQSLQGESSTSMFLMSVETLRSVLKEHRKKIQAASPTSEEEEEEDDNGSDQKNKSDDANDEKNEESDGEGKDEGKNEEKDDGKETKTF